MKTRSQLLAVAALAAWQCGCTTTSIKQTWKSPDAPAPVRKISVLAVDDRRDVRMAVENRFVRELHRVGHEGLATRDLLGLGEIKADRAAAAARLHEAGVDAVLIVRLVDAATYQNETATLPVLHSPEFIGYASYDWYSFYSYAFGVMGSVSMTAERQLYFDTSLFDLQSGRRVWSALVLTILHENADALENADAISEKVARALRKDGMIQ